MKQRVLQFSRMALAMSFAMSFLYAPVSVLASSQISYDSTSYFQTANSSWSTSSRITHDTQNATYAAGNFGGTVDFDASSGTDSHTVTNFSPFLTKINSDGTYGWTRIMDDDSGSGSVTPQEVLTDSQDNVYSVGAFSGGPIFDGVGGSDSQNITGGGTYITKYSAGGTYQWTKTIIPPSNGDAAASAAVIDTNDNIYLIGRFQNTVNFGAIAGGTDNHTSGGTSIFITKLNANETYGWTKTTGGVGGFVGVSDASLHGSELAITGYFDGTVDFDGGSGVDNHTDQGGNGNVYLLVVNTDGDYQWARSPDTSGGYTYSSYVSVDPQGNVFFSGVLGQIVDLDDNGPAPPVNTGNNDTSFVVKYGSSGTYQWSRTFDTSAGGYAPLTATTTDRLGNLYMLSALNGEVNFAGSSGSNSINDDTSGAITAYSPSGEYLWTRSFNSVSGSIVFYQGPMGDIDVDSNDNLLVASVFNGNVLFDGPNGSDAASSGPTTGFLSRFSLTLAADPFSPASNLAGNINSLSVSNELASTGENNPIIILIALTLFISSAITTTSLWLRLYKRAR